MHSNNVKTRLVFSVLLATTLCLIVVLALSAQGSLQETAFSKQNLIRLHVVANSNLPKDQDLKLLVRDAVLDETRYILRNVRDQGEAYQLLTNNSLDLEEIAQSVVAKEGFNYPVRIKIGNFPFPYREYGSFSLPEGFYDAVRVEIGEASGDNWWCVLFPPLCLAELESDHSGLFEVSYTSEETNWAFRWKLWEKLSETQYAKRLQKWWQASAATYPILPE